MVMLMGLASDVGGLVVLGVGVNMVGHALSKNKNKIRKSVKGWKGESARHSMSRYGIKTGRKTLSVKKAKEFSREEKRTFKTYKSYGFPKLAKDEARHSKVFKKYAQRVKA
jgi:hypothetical protein